MLWIKALHIVFVASWFAGLFYLPRIFVNMAMETNPDINERLLVMARKLYRFMTLLMIPALVLGLGTMAFLTRLMRSSLLEIVHLDYVRTAKAKGLSDDRIAWRHVLPNAILPMVTMLGLQFGTLLGGSVVIESVFSLPGIGRLAFESVVNRDLNTLLGIVFMSALLVITVNLIVDLLYAQLDPRIESA